jgi:N-acetylmuramic acid 6-phosphate etherase
METEQRLARYRDTETWPTQVALAAMLDNQLGAFDAVRDALPAIAAATGAAAARLGQHGRLIYCGAGTSARIAVQDGVELPPTFGWPHDRLAFLIAGGPEALMRSAEGAEDDAAAARRDAAALHPTGSDVMISLAASGATPYTRAAQRVGRAAGALTVAIANNPASPLLKDAEHPILLRTGAEFLAGSTRMTAGTAQKMALNLFSTQLMTELGHVHHGMMVDMVASNAKLVTRARRMVAEIAGVPEDTAAAAWDASGRSVKVAVLMLDGLTRADAEERLRRSGGRLGKARPRQAANV